VAGALKPVDWSAPWFEPWREVGQRVNDRWQGGMSLHTALNAHARSSPICFAPASDLPAGAHYETHVLRTGRCPTRENRHDFFNGLVWLQWPLAKWRLNALQAGEIARLGVTTARGPVRDAMTLLDENGALLRAPAALWDALVARDWHRLFIDLRERWAESQLIVWGHALLDKLQQPRKDLTAHVWGQPCPPEGSLEELDAWLATQLTPERLAAKPFTPLPVLGVPGWSPGNENFSFYDDSLVFRPAGRQKQI